MKPPIPSDIDLRDFGYMPLDVVRLYDSDLMALATGDEFRAAVALWCKAWHQVPAGSLPSDERLLAHLAGFGRDLSSWRKVRDMALRGFDLRDDGRLYHRVICEKAMEAWDAKTKQRSRTKAATAARSGRRDDDRDEQRDDERNDMPDEQRDDEPNDERNVHQGKGREGKGKSIALASDTARAQGDPPHSRACIDLLDTRSADLDPWETDFLVSIKWAETLTKAQADKLKAIDGRLSKKPEKHPSAVPKQTAVLVGTPAWDAWRKAGKIINTPVDLRDEAGVIIGRGWYFPTEFPPQDTAA